MNNWFDILFLWTGSFAGFLTTVSFFPQVYKVLHSKSAKDLSWGWLSMMSLGVFLWILYGLHLKSVPIVLANIVTLLALFVLIFAKIIFDKKSSFG